MTRRADSKLVKAKRQVIRLAHQRDAIAAELSTYLDYPYAPAEWSDITPELFRDDPDLERIHEVTEKRYELAAQLVQEKTTRRSLSTLIDSGSATPSQVKSFKSSKVKISALITELNDLPDLGESFAGWEALPAEFKQKGVGHPKITAEERYAQNRSELNMQIAIVNAEERKEAEFSQSGAKLSTIDSILAEEKELVVNAGRKSLDGPVAEIEELERKKRSTLAMIEDIENEPDNVVQKGRGKRKRPKAVRLQEKRDQIAGIVDAIAKIESELSPLEFGMRHKRVLERERRYAKANGDKKLLKDVNKRLEKLERAMKSREDGNISDKQLMSRVVPMLEAATVTVDKSVDEVLSETNAKEVDTQAEQSSTVDIMDDMEFPVY